MRRLTDLDAESTGRISRAARRDRTGWRAVLHAINLGVSVGLVFLIGGLALLLIVIPKATGSTPLTVLTQSMEPKLPPGTLLIVRPVAVKDIRIGDVITYQIVSGQPAVISHRVVSITSTSNGSRAFVLKGDNNAAPDSNPVTPAQIRGILWYSIPKLGYVNQLVNGSRTWLVPALAGILLAYGAVMVVLGIVASVRRRRQRPAGVDRPVHGRRSATRTDR